MRIFTATVVSGLLAAAAFTYWVDPAHSLRRRPFDLGTGWEEGRILVFANGANDRLLRLNQLSRAPAPELLLLGSSRMMMLHSGLFASGPVFNAGVIGASIEDHAAFWQALKENAKLPKRLIIFADPWLLNANAGQVRWRANMALYERFMRGAPGRPISPAALTMRGAWQRLRDAYTFFYELLNWFELQAAWRQWRAAAPSVAYATESSGPASGDGWRFDGSQVRFGPAPTLEQSRELALEYATAAEIFSLGRYRIDALAAATLSALIEEAARAGAKVLLVELPYHPIVFDRLGSRREYAHVLPLFTSTLDGLPGRGRDFEVCDASNPRLVGCDESEFYDGMHPTLSCHEKVLRRCLSPRAGWKDTLRPAGPQPHSSSMKENSSSGSRLSEYGRKPQALE